MKLVSMSIVGGIAYFAGYEWNIIPDPMASIAVIAAFYIFVSDLWSDPVPNGRQRQKLVELAVKVEPRLIGATSEEAMRQITAQPTSFDPNVLLSEVLEDDDRKWLEEQVQIIVKEESK